MGVGEGDDVGGQNGLLAVVVDVVVAEVVVLGVTGR